MIKKEKIQPFLFFFAKKKKRALFSLEIFSILPYAKKEGEKP